MCNRCVQCSSVWMGHLLCEWRKRTNSMKTMEPRRSVVQRRMDPHHRQCDASLAQGPAECCCSQRRRGGERNREALVKGIGVAEVLTLSQCLLRDTLSAMDVPIPPPTSHTFFSVLSVPSIPFPFLRQRHPNRSNSSNERHLASFLPCFPLSMSPPLRPCTCLSTMSRPVSSSVMSFTTFPCLH